MMAKIAFVVLLCAGSFSSACGDAPVRQARWPQLAGGYFGNGRLPLWNGACPASYVAWTWAKGRDPICVQKA